MKPVYFLLNADARSAPVAALGLGSLTEVLESTGFLCVGDLLRPVQGDRNSLAWICGLEPEETQKLRDAVERLRSYVSPTGDVDWDGYRTGSRGSSSGEPVVAHAAPAPERQHEPWSMADAASGELVPSFEVRTGDDFVRAFPDVIEAVVRARDNEVDRAILVERLTRQPGDRKTLDQIANSLSVRITRERVRQRETKLLQHLSNALLHGRQRLLGVRFRSDFTNYWRTAAEQFGARTEITFAEFLGGLEAAWAVSADRLFVHLPLITSVLTRSATIPEALRAQMRRDARVYREVAFPDRDVPVVRLAVGKGRDALLGEGITTVGELFEAAKVGRGPDPRTSAGRQVESVLRALAEALGPDGRIDWKSYEMHLGLVGHPASEPPSMASFLSTLADDVEALIRTNGYSMRAVEIFRLRIAVPKRRRLTLAEAAERLGTHGPSVKREESVMLEGLNEHLVEGDLSSSSALISPMHLCYWQEAANLYKECGGDFDEFRRLAEQRWDVSAHLLTGSAEILWAVLDRYPAGRPPRALRARQRAREAPPATGTVATVVLRGFQRVH